MAIMLVAAVLRLWGLGSESLWIDQLTTLARTQWSPMRIITESVIRGTPPLYYLPPSMLYGALPAGEWGLRLPSAVAQAVLEEDGWRGVLKDDARYIRLRVYGRTTSAP